MKITRRQSNFIISTLNLAYFANMIFNNYNIYLYFFLFFVFLIEYYFYQLKNIFTFYSIPIRINCTLSCINYEREYIMSYYFITVKFYLIDHKITIFMIYSQNYGAKNKFISFLSYYLNLCFFFLPKGSIEIMYTMHVYIMCITYIIGNRSRINNLYSVISYLWCYTYF